MSCQLLIKPVGMQVEKGSKNHEVVPTTLITQLSGLRGASGVNKCISSLAKVGLIAKVKNAKCTKHHRPDLTGSSFVIRSYSSVPDVDTVVADRAQTMAID